MLTAKVDTGKSQIVALIGRIEKFSASDEGLLKKRAEVKVVQISPLKLVIQIGQSGYSLEFPVPVLKSRSHTRIAYKSSWIEVTAPVADHANEDGFADLVAA